MVDAADSKSAAARHAGSSPASGTTLPLLRGPLAIGAALIVGLGACGDARDDTLYPDLIPTEQALAAPAIPGHATIAATSPDQVVADLRAKGQNLAVGAAEISGPVLAASNADLLARAARLRNRSDRLRGQSLVRRNDLSARAAALRARAAALRAAQG